MELLLNILVIPVLSSHVAGQIYLVSFAIKKARTNVFLKIVIGILFFLFINIPGLTASALLGQTTAHTVLPDQNAVHTLPWLFLLIIVASWGRESPASALFNSPEIIGCSANEKERQKIIKIFNTNAERHDEINRINTRKFR